MAFGGVGKATMVSRTDDGTSLAGRLNLMLLIFVFVLTRVSANTALQAASLMGTYGPPKGQPVAVAMSVSMPSFWASASVKRSISIHLSDK